MRHYNDKEIDYLVSQVTPIGLWQYCLDKKWYDDSEYIRNKFLKHE